MKLHTLFLSVAMLTASLGLHAAGAGGGGGDTPVDPVLQVAKAAIAKKDWNAAQTTLKEALARNAQNADYHNLYAYSLRKAPNPDMKVVLFHYGEALRIDPRHQGAHEYIGEAYLQMGNLAKAKEHLAALNKLCFFGCEEYTDLKEAISKYEGNHAG